MNLSELLESVRRVELRTNRLVTDSMVGAYLSRFKGRGMEFEELREYLPGDDVRDLDWNVTRRMGRPFVKHYREERELAVVLAVDVSGSLHFGSGERTKAELAAEIAATLAFSAARNGDKVALLLFTSEVEQYVPPRKGRRHILRLIRELVAVHPRRKGTHLAGALQFLNRVVKRRALVFLITDFLHLPATQAASASGMPDLAMELGLTHVRHDMVCLHLHDPLEGALPRAGLVTLEDAETGELLEVDTLRRSNADLYARENRNRLAALDSALNRTGVDTLRLDATQPFSAKLQRFFELRRGRRHG